MLDTSNELESSRNGTVRRLATLCAVLLLTLQVCAFLRARVVDSRYFCWAPFHSEARYRIDATVADRALTDPEIARRYGIAPLYWDSRARENWELNSITHVLDTIVATESRLPAEARAHVEVTYRVNGRPTTKWQLP